MKNRWYDDYFVKRFVDSFKLVPLYQRENVANQINEVVKNVFKQDIHHKVNLNKRLILGRYKEYEKRRWYDRSMPVFKSIRSICSVVDQPIELQKKAVIGIVNVLGEHYLLTDPKRAEVQTVAEIRQEKPPVKNQTQKTVAAEALQEKKAQDSKVMVSGEKLFVRRDKPAKPFPKKKLSLPESP